jgi:hypothetical protein
MENGKEAIETRKIDNGRGKLNGDREFIARRPFRERQQITAEGYRPIEYRHVALVLGIVPGVA